METVEQELLARQFQHKYTILGADLALKFRDEQCRGDVALPEFMVEQQTMNYVSSKIRYFLEHGTFEKEYEKAYNNIKDILPDNYSTLM